MRLRVASVPTKETSTAANHHRYGSDRLGEMTRGPTRLGPVAGARERKPGPVVLEPDLDCRKGDSDEKSDHEAHARMLRKLEHPRVGMMSS
jgi:hypothetical protein